MRIRKKIARLLAKIGKSSVTWGMDFPDFASALAVCNAGYESRDIADVVVAKTRRLVDNQPVELPPPGILLAAASLAGRGSSLRIVDIGGAAGAHYVAVRRIIPRSIHLDWIVVETSAMVAAATRLDHGGEVSFSTELTAALRAWSNPPDLVLASGVLMCLPDPLATLEQICDSRAGALVFARTGLSPDAKTRIIIQESRLKDNGPGPLPAGFTDRVVRYPNTFIPQEEFERQLGRNHEIRFAAVETSKAWTAGDTAIPQFAYVAHTREAHGAAKSSVV